MTSSAEPLIQLSNVTVVYGEHQPGPRVLSWLTERKDPVIALRNVDLSVHRGEALGLVGESGSGKTTIGRTLMGLVKATTGTVTFDGVDVSSMDRANLRALRARMQMVYQDSLGSFDPRMRVGTSVAEPLRIHGPKSQTAPRQAAIEALDLVGLTPGEDFYSRFPNELSGGQQQRSGLARALVTRPEVLVLDESLSSADVSIRVRLLDLLVELRSELNLTYVFITHDLALARYICDRLVVLYRGEVVETGPAVDIFDDPRHPYTRALIQAVPSRPNTRGDGETQLDPEQTRLFTPVGCPLFGGCPIGVAGVCDVTKPPLLALASNSNRAVSCHFSEVGQRLP